jgi:hypothetical protein
MFKRAKPKTSHLHPSRRYKYTVLPMRGNKERTAECNADKHVTARVIKKLLTQEHEVGATGNVAEVARDKVVDPSSHLFRGVCLRFLLSSGGSGRG